MTITLNVQNEQLFDKVLWLLNHLKNDGLEILTSRTKQKELLNGFLNPIEVKSHDFISRMTRNPKRISADTKFLSRDEANE
jgi:hypothetical protein